MKILDVIKNLTKNTSETFESNGWKAHIENGAIVFDNDKYPIIEINLNDNWQLVKQPVTWQEAIQAWADGKRVTLKLDRREYAFCGFSDPANTRRAIKSGTWYVED